MLILTRSAGESVAVGRGTVWVIEIKGRQARLGFDFPPEVKILRSELLSAPLVTTQPERPPGALTLRDQLSAISSALHHVARQHTREIDFLSEAVTLKFKIDAMLGRQ